MRGLNSDMRSNSHGARERYFFFGMWGLGGGLYIQRIEVNIGFSGLM